MKKGETLRQRYDNQQVIAHVKLTLINWNDLTDTNNDAISKHKKCPQSTIPEEMIISQNPI